MLLQTCYFLLLNYKDILKNVNQTVELMVAIDILRGKKYYVTDILQNTLIVIQQKKETHTGLEQHTFVCLYHCKM